jgi:hypothetical protein
MTIVSCSACACAVGRALHSAADPQAGASNWQLLMRIGGGITYQDSQKAPGWQDASVSTPSMGSLLCAVIGTAIHVRIPLLWNSCSQSCSAHTQQLLFNPTSTHAARHKHLQHSNWSTNTS